MVFLPHNTPPHLQHTKTDHNWPNQSKKVENIHQNLDFARLQ